MTEKPLISVIVPVYNVQDCLKECVESIREQTYDNLEIILVDDGSTDGSGTICDSYALRDSRIRVVHKKNGGLSSARNAGLDIMRGKYVSFVDGDDLISSKLYEMVIERFNERDYDLVAFGYCYFKNNGSMNRDKLCVVNKNLECDRRETFRLCLYKSISSCTKVYHKRLFQNIRYTEGVISEDAYILPDIIRQVKKCFFLGYIGYFYRQREGSITHSAYKNGDIGLVLGHYRLCLLAKKGDSNMIKTAEYRMGTVYNMLSAKWRNNSFFDLIRYKKDMSRIVYCYRQVIGGIQNNTLIEPNKRFMIKLLCNNLPIWFLINKYLKVE